MRPTSIGGPSPSPLRPCLMLGPGQYLYFTATLLLLLPLISAAPFYRDIDDRYAQAAWGPALERALGFRMTTGPHPAWPKERGDFEYIAYIEPGGIFDQAGFQVGDWPDRRCSICTRSIYTLLEWNRGGYAVIDVFRRHHGASASELLTLVVRVPPTR
jgi:hypothetical protein